MAVLCCSEVRHGRSAVGAAARHRRPVFRPLGLATGYESWPKRKRRGRRGSPRLNTEDGAVQRGRRRCPAARALRCSWTGLQEYTSGLLDSTGRRTRLLRSRGGSAWPKRHRRRRCEGARWRSTGGGDEQWRIGRKKQRRRIYTPGQRYRVKNTTGTYVILRYRLLTHPVPLASLRYRFLAHPVP